MVEHYNLYRWTVGRTPRIPMDSSFVYVGTSVVPESPPRRDMHETRSSAIANVPACVVRNTDILGEKT